MTGLAWSILLWWEFAIDGDLEREAEHPFGNELGIPNQQACATLVVRQSDSETFFEELWHFRNLAKSFMGCWRIHQFVSWK
jgi:hypothetical protein